MSKPKVLYVDDQLANLVLFEASFEEDYAVLLAEDAMAGFDIIEANDDLKIVISDMRMPNVDGIEFIKRARSRFPDISYYILTAFENTAEMQNALQTRIIRGFFRKPFNVYQLSTEINKVLKEATAVNSTY